MVFLCLIPLKLGRGEHAAQKQPRAMSAADEIGVLALPAKSSRRRQRLFHYRGRVHEDFNVFTSPCGKAGRDFLQTSLDDVMIIAVARINGNGTLVPLLQNAARVFSGP